MATERLHIVVDEDGSRIVSRNLNQMSRAAVDAGNSVYFLQRALQTLGLAALLSQAIKYADAWTSLTSRVRTATESHAQMNAVMEELYSIANRTYQPIDKLGELYQRGAIAAKNLGTSQADLLKFTEAVSLSLAVQNTATTTAEGAMLQLGQVLGGVKVQQQEYGSLTDGMTVLLQAVANNFDAAGGSVSRLGELVRAGKVPVKEFYDAILKSLPELQKKAAQLTPTFAKGFTVLSNYLIKFIGELNEASGASGIFVSAVNFIGENIKAIGAGLIGIGSAIAVLLSPAVFNTIGNAMLGLLRVNPFVTLAASVVSAISVILVFGDTVESGVAPLVSMQDLVVAFGIVAYETFNTAIGVVKVLWDDFTTFASSLLPAISPFFSYFKLGMSGVGDDGRTGFAKVLQYAAVAIDAILVLFRAVFLSAKEVFSGVATNVKYYFMTAAFYVAEAMQKITNGILAAYNFVATSFGKKEIELFKTNPIELPKEFVDEVRTFEQVYEQAYKDVGKVTQNKLNEIFDTADRVAKERLAKTKVEGDPNLSGSMGSPLPRNNEEEDAKKRLKEQEKAAREYKQFVDQVDAIRDRVLPAAGVVRKFAEEQELMNRAVHDGVVSQSEYEVIMQRLTEKMKEALDPSIELNREMQKETDLLKLNTREREVETKVLAAAEKYKQAGIQYSLEQAAADRKAYEALRQLNEERQIRDSLQAGSQFEKDRTKQLTRDQINSLTADPTSNFTKDDALRYYMEQNQLLFENTQESVNMQIAEYQRMYQTIAELRADNLISEETAEQMRAKVKAERMKTELSTIQTFFSDLSSLSQSENKKLALIGKAAAVTEAIIRGQLAVQMAFASAPPPASYALAAAAAAQAAINVAKVANVPIGFRTGGEFTVGGTGGHDSQLVAFRGTPGEKVTVSRPDQVRRGNPNEPTSSPQQTPRIINVFDKSVVREYLHSKDGNKDIVNIMEVNKRSFGSF